MPLCTVEEAVEDIKAGKMVIIVDDEDRENEGDLAIAAELVTPDIVNFMATYGRGLICVPMLAQRLDQLRLPSMVQDNTARLGTAFTVSVDVLDGATTGISAADRAKTIQALLDPKTRPEDLGRPGLQVNRISHFTSSNYSVVFRVGDYGNHERIVVTVYYCEARSVYRDESFFDDVAHYRGGCVEFQHQSVAILCNRT